MYTYFEEMSTLRSAAPTPPEFGAEKPAFLSTVDGAPVLAQAPARWSIEECKEQRGTVTLRSGGGRVLGAGAGGKGVCMQAPGAGPAAAGQRWVLSSVGPGLFTLRAPQQQGFLSRMGNRKVCLRSSAEGDLRCAWSIDPRPSAAGAAKPAGVGAGAGAGAGMKTTVSSYNIFSHDNTAPGALAEYQVTERMLAEVGVAAVAKEDWLAWRFKKVAVTFDGKTGVFVVCDYCDDRDCSDDDPCCCSRNKGFESNGFLLDLDSLTVGRVWGLRHAEDSLLRSARFTVLETLTQQQMDEWVRRTGGRVDR